ncbi:MAG: NAD(P)H-dependent oxidoreductase subunit E, partial [Chitinispirillaceae bacterium]|nr:NAD(P)H-dependent oxidoreductase subunit E [Chitinispirillaceae bacterium]
MSIKIEEAVKKCNNDPYRLMDIILEVHKKKGFIDKENIKKIAKLCNCSIVDVEQTVSFYHFFSTEPRGKYTVYLNNSVTAEMQGREKIAKVFEKEVGCKFGSVSSDGLIGLFETSCIGMNDQEPAAIINGIVFPSLTEEKVKTIVKRIKEGKKIEDIKFEAGEGKNNSEHLKTFIKNNIRKKGEVILTDYTSGEALKKLSNLTPESLIDLIKKSNLRGRGGAGFPTGLKWEFCRKSSGSKKYVLCNADEGEPGTFKDRVILTEYPELVFEGMAIAGYAIGSDEGILYLRFEYQYLKNYLEKILEEMRKNNFLGKNICGIKGFNFDIRIQLGAGAYVCGEETALIESA